MLSQQHLDWLQSNSVRVFIYPDMLLLSKKPGTEGNVLPGYKSSPVVVTDEKMNVIENVYSDCPHVSVRLNNNNFIVSVWDWVPGPGPGDFETVFTKEDAAMEEVKSYFFGNNSNFKKRLEWWKSSPDVQDSTSK